ncbi:MAG: hypothetical protein ACOX7K_03375 [Oscillospiraceae bacterium]
MNSQERSKMEVANLTFLDYYKSEDQERSKQKTKEIIPRMVQKGVEKHGNQ